MKNQEVAEFLYKVANLLELEDEIRFKYLAYRKAAQTIESLPRDILEIYKKGGTKALEEIPSIGKAIADKIQEILNTNKLKYLEDLKSKTPIDIDSLMTIEGLGPKRIGILYQELKIKNIKDLETAAKKNKIKSIQGFSTKTQENIMKAIEFSKASKQRFVLGFVWPTIQELEKKIKSIKEVQRVEICGSARRRKETIADLDILTISNNPKEVINKFTKLNEVKRILTKGYTKSTVILKDNMQVDLRVLPKQSFGAAMQYFIGSKNHNIALRKIAISKGYKLSEYGLFKGNNIIAAEDEKEIYKALGLDYIEPELRENTGEVQLAMKHKLLNLIQLKDIKGDTHIHTNQSDGLNSIEEMIQKASLLRREYIVISDHTGFLKIANGLNESQLLKQKQLIEKLNKKYPQIKILSGCEVNIKDNGTPDIKDSVLKQLDVITASIHSGFKESEEKITNRVIKAMSNQNIDIIGHPTGRILQKREPFLINMNKVFEKAKETGTCLEINAFPKRVDLKDIHINEAIKNQVKLIIATDAHETEHMEFMQFGVWQARRGFAQSKDILNTLSLDKFLKSLK